MKNFLSAFLLLVILFSSISFAQSGMKPNTLPPNEASEYLQPLSTWIGTSFNSGAYYDASVPKLFGFKFNIIGMWTLIPDDQKSFQPDPQINGVKSDGPTATIFGSKASYYLGSKGFYAYPTGLSLSAMPFGIYQVAGSLYNTELMVRFFPKVKFGDVKFGVLGFGFKHEISSHIPLFPVNLAVQILYNKLDLEYVGDKPEDYLKIKSNNFAFNVHASKTFAGLFVVYGGLQYETSSMDFGYYFEDENNYYPALGNKIQNLSIDGDNHFRFTLGGAIKLGVLVLNTDVNLTKFTTFTTGLSFDF